MELKKIGFIGLGEVGRIFSREMKAKGADVYYFDVITKEAEDWIQFLPIKKLIETCEILLSTVSTHKAVEVARTAAMYLDSNKTYSDMNSTSASAKKQIARIIETSRADFIEGAILSAVGETGPKASILVSGEKAETFSRLMNHLGLVNLRFFSTQIGDSSLVKMIRSVFSKGVECLLLEMLIAGKRAGLADHLWKDIVDFMTKNPFDRVAENWIKTHPLASERRYHEMLQVIETLEEIDVTPVMTRGTKDFFERSVAMELGKRFEHKPDDFWDVVHCMEKELKMKGV